MDLVQPMRHSYTNDIRGDGSVVVKRYEGPDSATRRQREHTVLAGLHGRLPVPPLLAGGDDDAVRMGFVLGAHGQELIEVGRAAPVLRACGAMLRRIHAIDVAEVLPDAPRPRGAVLVHGDFGPNNVLFEPATLTVAAVVDWEWAHPGQPVEDLAWCEWTVRTHHPEHVEALDEFFAAYGHRPAWRDRHDAMLAQCRALLDLCQRWSADGGGVRLWQHRLDVTAAWSE